MLRYLCLILIGCGSAWGQLVWEKRELEFKADVMDTNVVARFTFRNAGKYPIRLTSVESSCGCTSILKDKKRYPPGEKGEILADFPFGQRLGVQEKKVLVRTDDLKESTVFLTFKVTIPELVRIEPLLIYWIKGEAPNPKSMTVKVVHSAPINVLRVQSSNPRLTPELQTVRAGGEYVVRVTPVDTKEPAMAILTIETDFPAKKPRSYRAYTFVKSLDMPPAAKSGQKN